MVNKDQKESNLVPGPKGEKGEQGPKGESGS